MKCPKCNGTGIEKVIHSGYYKLNYMCNFCNYKKDLDWIEYIFGVDNPVLNYLLFTQRLSK